MDLNDIRSAVTVSGLILFVMLVAWAWHGRRREAFREAAELPFQGESEGALQ